MIKNKVIICGVIKNIEKVLLLNINNSIKTGEMFEDYKIIIYENNSTDNTKELLKQYSSSDYPKIRIISEDIPYEVIKQNSRIWTATFRTGSDHPCRIEQISNARNKVVEEFNKPEYDSYDYVIWIDLDSKGWELEGIQDSFTKKDQWDAVFAGYDFYDHYALRLNPNIKISDPPYENLQNHTEVFCMGPEMLGETYWNLRARFNINFNNMKQLVPVYSAFNGLGIYKKELFKQNKYDCMVNDDVKIIAREFINHSEFEKYEARVYSKCHKFRSGGYIDDKTSIYWKPNSGYNKPVVCEHVCLHSSLVKNNYRLFINPTMKYIRLD